MLCNIHTGQWDEGMLKILDIPRSMLPEIRSSSEIYGYFNCLGTRVAISGIAGDQQAALFGQCCFDEGSAKNTYGTGCFLLAHTGNTAVQSKNGLLTTIAATEKGRPIEYALEGSVFVGGAIIQWLRDEMGIISNAAESEILAGKTDDCGGVYIVPAFAGLGAPYWDMHARGTIVGLTRGSGRNHIVRAALEAIAYQTEDVIRAMSADMSELGESHSIKCLLVDGGASNNALLMQMQSDISSIDVLKSANAEATARGAAFLAGLSVGFFRDREDIKQKCAIGAQFSPKMSEDERKRILHGWHKAVEACRQFSAPDNDTI
jgi:glycerol kinase